MSPEILNSSAIWTDPDRLGGKPCFRGSRVPVQALFDYLAGGHSITEFLDDFPPVTRQQVDEVLRLAGGLFKQASAA